MTASSKFTIRKVNRRIHLHLHQVQVLVRCERSKGLLIGDASPLRSSMTREFGAAHVEKVYEWLDERLGLNDLYKNLLDRPEPKGNWWNTLGSASCSYLSCRRDGIFLAVYYTPSPDHAYDSINYIMNGVAFGWLIRGIHHWVRP